MRSRESAAIVGFFVAMAHSVRLHRAGLGPGLRQNHAQQTLSGLNRIYADGPAGIAADCVCCLATALAAMLIRTALSNCGEGLSGSVPRRIPYTLQPICTGVT